MPNFDNHSLNEFVSMQAARRTGIAVAAAELTTFPGAENVFVTKRYDRQRTNGRLNRIHQEDMAQALSVPPAMKYQRDDGGPGVADIAGIIQRFPLLEDRQNSARTFFDALVFNAAIHGTDAHAKNYSVLITSGRLQLAPLYDVASNLPYNETTTDLPSSKSAMRIGNTYTFDSIGESDWIKTGAKLRIPADESVERFQRVSASAIEAIYNIAEATDQPQGVRAYALRLAEQVEKVSTDRGRAGRRPVENPKLTQADNDQVWVSAHTRGGLPIDGHFRKNPTQIR